MGGVIGIFVVVPLLVSAWMTRQLSRPSSVLYVLDHPNERSLHNRPTPRTGGVAIVIAILMSGVVASIFYYSSTALWSIGIALIVVGGISLLDDQRNVPVVIRLITHLAAAGLLVLTEQIPTNPAVFPSQLFDVAPSASAVLFVIFIVWMINLYNFMDGMDGFAGGMAVIGFAFLAALGWKADNVDYAVLNLAIAAAAAGFLRYNFPPARIFMGDTGSSVLGLLVAIMSLRGTQEGVFPLWIPLLVFSPFVVDATVTLARRILRGERVWQAHRTHYYQRLVQLGWGHRKTVLWEYGFMLACGISALYVLEHPPYTQWIVLAGWAAVYAMLALIVNRFEKRQRAESKIPTAG